MSEPLRILLADGSPESLHEYSILAQQLGHHPIGMARTGPLLVQRCLALEPDLIIANAFLPEMGGIAALNAICRQQPTPAILVSDYYDQRLIEQAGNDCVTSYLLTPVAEPALQAAIWGTVQRFRQMQSLRLELARCRREPAGLHRGIIIDTTPEVAIPR